MGCANTPITEKMLDQHLGGADLYVFRFCNSFCNDLSSIVTLICIVLWCNGMLVKRRTGVLNSINIDL